MSKTNNIIEYGDFQTPALLVKEVLRLISHEHGEDFNLIVEPTCGVGNFLVEAGNVLPKSKLFGFDINDTYILEAGKNLHMATKNEHTLSSQDFFLMDWNTFFLGLKGRFLIIGNPPWTTNSQMGSIKGSNLPQKQNFQGHSGFDALTGKSNFDISEWILIRLADSLDGKDAVMAMLCKTSVARKFLLHSWKSGTYNMKPSIYLFDAKKAFGVSVDACLLVCEFSPVSNTRNKHDCTVFESLDPGGLKKNHIGFRNQKLISNTEKFDTLSEFFVSKSNNQSMKWRSGIKHDCSSVMELELIESGKYLNGLGEIVELEKNYVFPLMKSSDVAKSGVHRKYVIATQKTVKDDPSGMKDIAPLTWNYLLQHAEFLEKRTSTIYRNRPRFSIFGVGEYSYAPYKIAVSGLYKNLNFQLIKSLKDKPILLDDTVNFLSFSDLKTAELYFDAVSSTIFRDLLTSFIFSDNKRPVTIEILNSINLDAMVDLLAKNNT